jgi:hypothetical protein
MKSWLKVFSRKTSHTLHVIQHVVEFDYTAPMLENGAYGQLRLSQV